MPTRKKGKGAGLVPTPRREPRTQLGEGIVEAILVAAETCLRSEGLASLSTAGVARMAGVSVGSLYQYFPNKESIVRGVAERIKKRGGATAATTLETVKDESMPELTRAMMQVLLSTEMGDLEMRRGLLRDVPPRWLEGTHEVVQEEFQRKAAELLRTRAGEIRQGMEPEVLAFVVCHAVESVIQAAMVSRPDLFEDPSLVDELTLLAWGYLKPQA